MNILTKEYCLTQQTPLIHFQSDESGATLRASEVKPKLDRFLLKRLGDGDYEEGIKKAREKGWLIGEHPALRYKMRFKAGRNTRTGDIKYKIFYANMGKERKKNPLKFLIGDCNIVIVCFSADLFEFIDKYLSAFFISHTFGFMQGKGFGGYILDDKRLENSPTQSDIAKAINLATGCGKVYACVNKQQSNDCIFDKIIKPFHSIMKSGINYKNYERSYIFQYFHQKSLGYGNDKAFVKSRKIAPSVIKEKEYQNKTYPSSSDYKYIRALLGICEKIEYIKTFGQDGNDPKEIVNIKSLGCIDRFACPVRYRIIDKTLYVFAVPVDDKIYGNKFKFSSSTGQGEISVPEKNDFDIQDFLSSYINHINGDQAARKAAGFINIKFREVKPND